MHSHIHICVCIIQIFIHGQLTRSADIIIFVIIIVATVPFYYA